jgi:hypothetical protein
MSLITSKHLINITLCIIIFIAICVNFSIKPSVIITQSPLFSYFFPNTNAVTQLTSVSEVYTIYMYYIV